MSHSQLRALFYERMRDIHAINKQIAMHDLAFHVACEARLSAEKRDHGIIYAMYVEVLATSIYLHEETSDFTLNHGVEFTEEDAIGSDNLDAWLDLE